MTGLRNPRYEQRCQLCSAEPSTTWLAGVRLGDRCHARAMAIAAEAQVPIERSVEHTRAGGLVCTHCGAELVVDERRLSIACPNGHPVEIPRSPDRTAQMVRDGRPARPSPRPHKPYKKATYQPKDCAVCWQLFQPIGGRDVRCPTCKTGTTGTTTAEVPSE